ncbi:MAG: helix-turn-helix transcriptional regulator [Bacteroidales bacterium]|nr:helix-turn-helix transcriptional regulator [Bacteroidales bacterium]
MRAHFDSKSKERQKIAHKLYLVRTQLGITQVLLQKEGIISQSHLSKIENAEINISAIMLHALAKRYGKDMSYFFE